MNLAQLAQMGMMGGGGMGRRPMGGMRKPGMMDHGMGMQPGMGMPPPELPPREVPGAPPEMGIKPKPMMMNPMDQTNGGNPLQALLAQLGGQGGNSDRAMGRPMMPGGQEQTQRMGGEDQLGTGGADPNQGNFGGLTNAGMAKPAMMGGAMGGNMMRQNRDTGGLEQILQMLRGRG